MPKSADSWDWLSRWEQGRDERSGTGARSSAAMVSPPSITRPVSPGKPPPWCFSWQGPTRPFAKWIFHGLRDLGQLGSAVHGNLLTIVRGGGEHTLQAAAERCAGILIDELVNQGLAVRRGSFLLDYGAKIGRTIDDPTLREGLDTVD